MTAQSRSGLVPAAMRPPRWRTYLRLGRVSNLPTVWTNVLAGMLLAQAPFRAGVLLALALIASVAYVGGMLLNDAFDRRIDAAERPERPIPSGHVSAGEVFAVGFGLLVSSFGAVVVTASIVAPANRLSAALSAAALIAFIVLYDAWHKENPLSPLMMGACRASVYFCAAFAAGGSASMPLVLAAASLLAYVVGLTFVARQENRHSFTGYALLLPLLVPAVVAVGFAGEAVVVWIAVALFVTWVGKAVAPLFARTRPNVPQAVVRMIAGIALLDGLFIAAYAPLWLAVAGPLGLVATLALQRYVRGT